MKVYNDIRNRSNDRRTPVGRCCHEAKAGLGCSQDLKIARVAKKNICGIIDTTASI